jgi:hypothetical protein
MSPNHILTFVLGVEVGVLSNPPLHVGLIVGDVGGRTLAGAIRCMQRMSFQPSGRRDA